MSTTMTHSVLLVDDNPTLRHTLRCVFESAGYAVCGEADDGANAIEQATRLHPELIVLDLAMPVMNGLQAATLLRQLMPSVPIILFTLYAGGVVEEQAKAAGVSAVISKDDAFGSLLSQAQTLLNS